MHKEQPDRLDPNQPSLTVLVGVTRRKHRPLVGDVILVGRAAGCDIGLVSPEVAPVHCVLLRLPGGWRIRDCSGRGTRVNGNAAQDQPLHNGDTIQVGAFSFELHLPATAGFPVAAVASPGIPVAAVAPTSAAGDIGKLEQSRRRLARRALLLRARLRQHGREQDEVAARQADLDRLEARLRAGHQEQLTQLTQERKRLEARAAELDNYARHLRQQAGAAPSRPSPELQRRQAELDEAAAELQEFARRERDEIAAERAALNQQREDLTRLRAELERNQSDTPPPAGAHYPSAAEAVPDRLESARRLLSELAQRRKNAVAPSARLASGPRGV